MNKRTLIQKIISKLSDSMELLEKAARASHAEATHESSKAENKYDTRGLEAAYLAGGQAKQAREILDSLKLFGTMEPRDFAATDPIDISALVEVDSNGERDLFFIAPRNGGLEIDHDGREITLITPQSPLGQNLLGKTKGHTWSSKPGTRSTKSRIVSVW